jgi:pyruvate/2-oxoglutarate dehydrogenase complex dihydrolipoamide dehydrogenase (E3) component
MKRVHDVIHKVAPHDSIERYTSLGVDCIDGEAKITSPYSVEVNGRTLTTKSIVIATGARPFIPPIPGLEKISYLTSDNIWNLEHLPERLVVLGGGPIGSELTQAFARLGSAVTQVEMAPQIMGREDPDVSAIIRKRFEDEGIRVFTDHTAKEILVSDGKKILVCDHNNETIDIEFDEILVAVGRTANSKGFGLEELDVQLNPNKTIAVDEFLRTNIPNILAAGDVAGPYQFTHVAAHQAWYAAVNALFGKFKKFKTDYRVIPWATYTDPEVARVGINETDAKEGGIEYEVTIYGIENLDRAIADSENHGFVKVLTPPKSDKILGVTIVGPHASDIIAEYVFAMKNGLGLSKVLGTIHIYPTLAEANKYAAGEWKKAHAPESILKWVAKFHKWQRG